MIKRVQAVMLLLCALLYWCSSQHASANQGAINSVEDVRVIPDELGPDTVVLNFANRAIDVVVSGEGNRFAVELPSTRVRKVQQAQSLSLDTSRGLKSLSWQITDAQPNDESATLLIETYYRATLKYRIEDAQLRIYLEYPGQPIYIDGALITMSFQDIETRQALQLLAEHKGLNLLMSDSVQGKLSLNLKQVAWNEALEAILQLNQLAYRISGDLMVIAPHTEMEAFEASRDALYMQQKESGPLISSLFSLHYAKASDIAAMLSSDSGMSMLSERGGLSVDERTNSLLVRDTKRNTQALREVIDSLDVAVKQVQIEARIVSIDQGNIDELGVRWGLQGQSGSNSVSGSIEGNLWQEGDGASIADFLNVNLGLSNPNASSIAFQVATLGSDLLLDLELSALEAESKAEIISSPKILTTNKKPAYIEQGTEIPYLEAASSGATSVSFRKAVLSLEVTPQVTPDNRLILDVSVTQDRPGEVVKTGIGEAVAINTQRISTQVAVDSGETLVLGGIHQQSQISNVEQLPGLGQLPIFGALFRRTSDKQVKSELLIFVTPTVIEP